MLESRTSKELGEIRALLAQQQRQIDALVSYFARMEQPPRPRWERHSMPNMNTDPALASTVPLPIMRKNTPPHITRITACHSGNSMFVTAYNGKERVMSGTSRQIGPKLIEWYPHINWELVAESA